MPVRTRRAARDELAALVAVTPLADTHEHLPDEDERLRGEQFPCDDWSVLLSHYLNSDLLTAGMPQVELDRFLGRTLDPLAKWALIAPWWPAVKHTGYGRAVRLAVRELYGADDLSAATIAQVQAGYERVRRPGFYEDILVKRAGIASCQVNYLGGQPFHRSSQPTLLLQDLSIIGAHLGPNFAAYTAGYPGQVAELSDWHACLDWWFATCGPDAVAVKSQAAYSRGLDYADVPAERAAPVFKQVLNHEPVTAAERKDLEDHLFWYCVRRATAHGLPVKLHLGYYAGAGYMPPERLAANPAQAAALCRLAPDTRFVFMHIAYPHWPELLGVVKHYRNAYADLCWAWVIDPVGARQFLKQSLVTAPANKVFCFGGDYRPVEVVLGHALIARDGITRALRELVDEGWMTQGEALELVPALLHGNADTLFALPAKVQRAAARPSQIR